LPGFWEAICLPSWKFITANVGGAMPKKSALAVNHFSACHCFKPSDDGRQ
jgi:hypothetical protein